ncbi:MAG: LamG domain-containing protein [Hyphomicrobiaceae bacterium]|nr:MAG: LamG domain-containing protein [Hyphomicrobiaceae bacterium]
MLDSFGLALADLDVTPTVRAAAWTPASLSSLVAWFDPSYGVYANSAAKFVAASSQQLSRQNTLGTNYNTDWSVSFWVNPTNVSGFKGLFLRNTAVVNLRMYMTGDTFTTDGFVAFNTVPFAGFFAAGTWTQVTVTYQGTGDKKMRLYRNGSLHTTSSAYAGTVVDDDAARYFYLGSLGGSSYLDGSMDSFGFWTRELSAGDVSGIYNNGSGKTYVDLTTAEKVSLVSWYDFATTASLATDAHGSNTLTNTNSVTCDAGIVAGQAVADDPIYQWNARAGSSAAVLTQATLANRFVLNVGANGKYYWTANGTSTYMAAGNTSDCTLTGDFTIAVLANCTNASSDRYLVSKQKTSANYDGYGFGRIGGKLVVDVSDGTYTSKAGATTVNGSQGWLAQITKRASATATVYFDNTSDGSGAVQGGSTAFAVALNIGRFAGGGQHWDGHGSHIVILSDDISDSDRTLLKAYFDAQEPT